MAHVDIVATITSGQDINVTLGSTIPTKGDKGDPGSAGTAAAADYATSSGRSGTAYYASSAAYAGTAQTIVGGVGTASYASSAGQAGTSVVATTSAYSGTASYATSSGNSSGTVAYKNVIIVNADETEIVGKRYQTVAAAQAYVAAVTPAPSATNLWGILITGANAENIDVGATPYVHFIGIKGVTLLTGQITSSATFSSLSQTDVLIADCVITNLVLTSAKCCIIRESEISGGTLAAAAIPILVNCRITGGTFTSYNYGGIDWPLFFKCDIYGGTFDGGNFFHTATSSGTFNTGLYSFYNSYITGNITVGTGDYVSTNNSQITGTVTIQNGATLYTNKHIIGTIVVEAGGTWTREDDHNETGSLQGGVAGTGGTSGEMYHLPLADYQRTTAGTAFYSGTASYASSSGQSGTALYASSAGNSGTSYLASSANYSGTSYLATSANYAGTSYLSSSANYSGTSYLASSANNSGTAFYATSSGQSGTSTYALSIGTDGTFNSLRVTGNQTNGTVGYIVNTYWGTAATMTTVGIPLGSVYIQTGTASSSDYSGTAQYSITSGTANYATSSGQSGTAVYASSAGTSFPSLKVGDATNYLSVGNTGLITMSGTGAIGKLQLRPTIVQKQTKVVNNVPTEVYRGCCVGYSMPIWNSDNEELYFRMRIPNRWDGTSDPQVGICTTVVDGGTANAQFNMQLEWQTTRNNSTMGTALSTVTSEQTILAGTAGTSAQSVYFVYFTLNADDATNPIITGEMLQGRLRRIAPSVNALASEVAVWDWTTIWATNKVFPNWSTSGNAT